ncbi:MAG TPA: PRC-barrel domain-containing protein [Verrucomicrobiae bacterium]|nr:PRC-barrel domain-containing protein [Verrucomicrobiae bacterium]
MKPTIRISAADRTLLTGLLVLNLSLNSNARELTRNSVSQPARSNLLQEEFTPGFLAERLGIAQKSTTLLGASVKEYSGKKIGKLEDVVVDLHSGRVLCALVSAGGAVTIAIPSKVFFETDMKRAQLAINDVKMDAVPRVNPDTAGLVSSLPASYSYFNQHMFWDAGAQIEARKCSELVGMNVKNNAGESLGRIVNLMVDLPTARVVVVVVSFAGKGTDLYAVPPQAFSAAADNSGLVLSMDSAKVSSLAQSDGFFWSNMADANWVGNAYHAFGERPDFDSAANTASATTTAVENVSASAQPLSSAPAKTDSELSQDILAAIMLDNISNLTIYKHAQIKPANGQVTLRGWVKNENQRSKLVSIASGVAGAANVHDEIQIK